jgi:hypothetical protein
MTNTRVCLNCGQEIDEYWVTASFLTKEDEVWDEQIGEVELKKDLAHNEMPFELEINGVTYKRED